MHVVLCNCSPAESSALARALVQEGLAACVNVIPGVASIHAWEGALQEDEEHTLLIKAPADRLKALRARIGELHSYTLPEILVLAVDVAASSPDYVGWVRSARPTGEVP